LDQDVYRLNRYTEELVADRRPSREMLLDERAFHARQAAALLSGVRPGAGIPSRRFLTRLETQIAHWIRNRSQRRGFRHPLFTLADLGHRYRGARFKGAPRL